MKLDTHLFKVGSQNILAPIKPENTLTCQLWTSQSLLHNKIIVNEITLVEEKPLDSSKKNAFLYYSSFSACNLSLYSGAVLITDPVHRKIWNFQLLNNSQVTVKSYMRKDLHWNVCFSNPVDLPRSLTI